MCGRLINFGSHNLRSLISNKASLPRMTRVTSYWPRLNMEKPLKKPECSYVWFYPLALRSWSDLRNGLLLFEKKIETALAHH